MNESVESQIAELRAQVRSLQDVNEVTRLMHLYHQACDGWNEQGTHKEPKVIAALFTEDGVWDIPVERDGVWSAPSEGGLKGSEAIAGEAKKLQMTPWVIHYVVNPLVQVDGDKAIGKFKAFVRVSDPKGNYTWVCGIYHADAVRTPAGWRFARLGWEPIDTWI